MILELKLKDFSLQVVHEVEEVLKPQNSFAILTKEVVKQRTGICLLTGLDESQQENMRR